MSIISHVLTTGDRLNNIKTLLEEVSKKTIKEVTKLIPINNVDIVFYDDPSKVIPHIGLGGSTMTSHLIMIPIDPTFSTIKTSIEEELPRTIAHELYHCLRNYSFAGIYTLLDALINEGLADHFEIEVTGKKSQQWDNALDENQIQELTQRAQKEFKSISYNHSAWFFGSNQDNIPKWTGYTLGFNLIKNYLNKYPKKIPSQLYLLDVKEFL